MIFILCALTVAGILVFSSIQEVSSFPRGKGGGCSGCGNGARTAPRRPKGTGKNNTYI